MIGISREESSKVEDTQIENNSVAPLEAEQAEVNAAETGDNVLRSENAIGELQSPRPTVKQIEREITRVKVRREIRKSISNMLKNLIVIAAIAVLLTQLVFSVMSVNRSSMNPLIQDGEVVIALRIGRVASGDIIAFYYNNKVLLKRVIAQAGDWVNIDEYGVVYVNDEPLYEPYVTEQSLEPIDIILPYQVPDGSFFVMGDHRAMSADSRLREIGAVGPEHIVGKVWLRIWPLSRINFFG